MKSIIDIFTEHPKQNGETYFQHLRCAATYGLSMVFSGIAAIIHAVFPFIFETAASDCAKKVITEVERRAEQSIIE